ncbi:POK18 protein, partial [Chordeiles acutipennis]|nr:POK18 protein [Chordeiles acutipennis]
VELRAVLCAFERWPRQSLNIVTDSQYVCNVVQRIDGALLREVNNQALFGLLKELCFAISERHFPFYILHVCSHTTLPGFIIEGNRCADLLTAPAWAAPVPDIAQQTIWSHQYFHQGARALAGQFGVSITTAKDIIASCPDCQNIA